ncbi:TetR family transcriptional regulator [Vibrio sp. qd031]|uniref:TetR/AcrR family transcriptional regulator n=1 Tax=Vibrio sp. qd031 TaxID=1603038 RepID=UPI000A112E2E|nr:TetR/AcrR family transcriptional regulator [Vibrio sp. qd031]ORT50742.1 TetR family transcriptional regulator [Vibrio sp. qd031]
MKTRDRIVLKSLELFNEQGERNVTTNHIAAHMNISTGNLYYHFSNKQEIILAIYELYEGELLERFSPHYHQQENLALLKHYLDSIFTLMWKYRFFYANLPEILQRDSALHQRYMRTQKELSRNLLSILDSFQNMDLVTFTDIQKSQLCVNLHMVAVSWIAYQSSMSLNIEITQKVIYQGMLQMISIIKPFATSLGKEQMELLEEGIQVMLA